MNRARLAALLGRLPQLRLLVLGDYFLDLYLEIDPALAELSLETGLVAQQVVQCRPSPGAAGNVAANARALGAQVIALGPLGDDGNGHDLRRALCGLGVITDSLLSDPCLMTPTYTKPLVREKDGSLRELNRLDIRNRQPLPAHVEAQLLARLADLAETVDGIIVNDQTPDANHGAITDCVRDALVGLGAARPEMPIVVDSRRRIGLFRQLTLKPNEHEALAALGWPYTEELACVQAAGQTLARQSGRPVFCTLGARGCLVCSAEGAALATAVPVSGEIDIVGAGDTALAAITTALTAGATPYEAAELGNLAAAVTIQCLGATGTASPDDLLRAYDAWDAQP